MTKELVLIRGLRHPTQINYNLDEKLSKYGSIICLFKRDKMHHFLEPIKYNK